MLINFGTVLLSAAIALGEQSVCSSGVCLPGDYNKMDLPGEKPIYIDTQLILMEIFEVNENDHTIHINAIMIFAWQDNRLNFTSAMDTSVDVDKQFIDNIWTPDLYIYHMKEIQGFNGITTMRGLSVQKNNDSVKLFYSLEANVKFICAMSFHAFPFESNVCKFRLTSYSFTSDQMVFKAVINHIQGPTRLVKENVKDYEVEVEYLKGNDTFQTDEFIDGVSIYSVVGLKITLRNLYMKYIVVYYLPTSMFTVTSWISFVLPPTSYPSRTSLLVTVSLCQIGLFNAVMRDTPHQDGGKPFLG